VKILDPRKATTEKRKRFANELHFCSRVDHPSIVQVVDYGSARIRNRDAPFYIMPFYKTTLRDLLRQKVRPERALTYFAHILDGVEAAHKKGVVHRDLKPENILHDEAADRLLVADFGIAQFAEEDLFTLVETQPTTRLANFQYAAPEQKVRSGSVTQRSDIYALGLILNELFTGEVAQGTAFRSIGDAVPAMEYLDALVGLMIRQNPQDRPASIEDVKRELIARGNDFVRLQKLNQSKSAVVPQEELDDPFVTDPIRLADIIDYDESEHRVVLQLSKQPSHDWIRIFHNLSGVTFHRGREPQTVQFHGSRAYVLCDEHNAPVQLTFFREWLARANENYARWAREQLAARIQTEKMALREAVAKEEARQRVLNRLRGQT
jgi:serine/threonine protein kinase